MLISFVTDINVKLHKEIRTGKAYSYRLAEELSKSVWRIWTLVDRIRIGLFKTDPGPEGPDPTKSGSATTGQKWFKITVNYSTVT